MLYVREYLLSVKQAGGSILNVSHYLLSEEAVPDGPAISYVPSV